ncbi:MAG: hypothetical protein QOG71_1714 [Pyrinomonadaceae bacterium]|nr:hypothetical protein [Pyrinomonadaceae bacterium]
MFSVKEKLRYLCEGSNQLFASSTLKYINGPPRAFFIHSMSKDSRVAGQDVNRYTDGLISPTDTNATQQINGSGVAAEKWVYSIEELTQQNNLRFLTFLPWKDILSNRTMHRRSHAWCPSCLEDQRVAGTPIHEQLLWAHRIVLRCPVHKVQLETECHHCKSSPVILCGKSRPGLCSHCKGWLGYYPNTLNLPLAEQNPANAAFEVFVAEQIGELIAVAPNLACFARREAPEISITKCVDQFFEGNLCAFARYFGMKKGVISCFTKSRARFIDLDLLSRIAFRAGTTLLNLLTNENALADFNPLTSSAISNKRLSPRLKKENVLKTLLEAVEEKPAPSLNELAERLGYSEPYILRRYFPQICSQITANYLTHSQGKRRGGWSTARLQNNEAILAALESALEEESPPSLSQVGRSLGYASSEALRSRFPELCKALTEKRQKLISSRRAMIEGELRQALESDPPISLNTISEKLGYKTSSVLRTMFPNECREIRYRHEEHTKNQFLSRIEIALQAMFIETPPPTLNAVLRRIGVSDGFLRKYFTEEHRALSTRFLEFRRQQCLKNKEIERNKIRVVVSDLIARGILPSMNIVLELLPTTHLKFPEVWATILRVKEEFARSV